MHRLLREEKRRHVKGTVYETVVEERDSLPAMIIIRNGEICLIPNDEGLQILTQPKNRSHKKVKEQITWENLRPLIETLKEIDEARGLLLAKGLVAG